MKKMSLKRRETLIALCFLTPALIGFFIFRFGPLIASLVISLLEWDLITDPEFVGLSNYMRLFLDDRLFLTVVGNTFIFVLGTVPVRIILALIFALILAEKIPFDKYIQGTLFLPVIIPHVAASMIFRWILHTDFGLLNFFLSSVGVPFLPNWLGSRHLAMISIIMLSVWKDVGFSTVIFVAGLKAIPEELYEAAKIDGASKWQRIRKITLPQLSSTMFFVIITNLITSFQVFDQAYVLTGGGPANATNTIVYFIYQNAFEWFRMGYGAAVAWVLFAIVFTVTAIQFKLSETGGLY